MKKLVVLAVLFGLSLALIASSASSLLATETEVEVREVLYEGSREAASGLSVTFLCRETEGQRLGWETSFTLTEGKLSPDTTFTFEPKGPIESQSRDIASLGLRPFNLSVSSNTDLLGGGSGREPSFSFADREISYKMAVEVAARTERGTVRVETLRLRDYAESLIWMAELRTGLYSIAVWDDTSGLSELFPVEVPEDFYMHVRIDRDASGAVRRIEVAPADGPADPVVEPYTGGYADDNSSTQLYYAEGSDGLEARTVAAAGPGGLWVCPSMLDARGRELVGFPQGRGVYFIPVVRGGSRGEDVLDTANARLMYPTDEECALLGLSGGNVELVTAVGPDLILTVLDGESGRVLGRSTLFEGAEARECAVTAREGLRLYTLNDGRFALTVCRDGETSVALTGRLDFETWIGDAYNTHTLSRVVRANTASLAWDGRRLAVAEGRDCQEVIVLDETGVLYHARFEFSPLWNGRSDYFPYDDARADSDYAEPMKVAFQ